MPLRESLGEHCSSVVENGLAVEGTIIRIGRSTSGRRAVATSARRLPSGNQL
jgi:hypothetical protein